MASLGKALRVGVIGVGQRGGLYAEALRDGEVPGATLAGVCDIDPTRLEGFSAVPCFSDERRLLASGGLDAVVIATPHSDHAAKAELSFELGLHVLSEKPIGIDKAECERVLLAYERRPRREQVFATALVMRADPRFARLHELVHGGELGPVRRIAWIVTDCFRSDAYYRASGWRGTWRGEGGGILLNQCLHQLDLFQWLFGMPRSVHAFLGFGRFHDIEVEDQVTAYFEQADGATGVFVASTGEAPGTNRLEVVGELGKVVIEGDSLVHHENATSTAELIRSAGPRSARPPTSCEETRYSRPVRHHVSVLRNFADAARGSAPLLSPGVEGAKSVELANALYLSAFESRTVALPIDAMTFRDARLLRIARDESAEDCRRIAE
jgi:predicted dehydrogenase